MGGEPYCWNKKTTRAADVGRIIWVYIATPTNNTALPLLALVRLISAGGIPSGTNPS